MSNDAEQGALPPHTTFAAGGAVAEWRDTDPLQCTRCGAPATHGFGDPMSLCDGCTESFAEWLSEVEK